jgi:glutathione synthase/RimK-type ligase-like ATP-grasp enzyme
MRIALVTCRKLPDLTDDDRSLVPAFAAAGAGAEAVVWDDTAVDWARFDRIVLRSVWDYHLRLDAFTAWLAARAHDGGAMWNPASLVRWNVHKSYLRTLAAHGVATVETDWLARGSQRTLPALMAERGWHDVVVKPAVSASAHRTFRVARAEATARQADLDAILADGDALVQPFAPEVTESGEWSLLFFGGAFSHAVCKRPAAADFRVQEEFGGRAETSEPGAAMIAQAAAALAAAPGRTAYARVDGIVRGGVFVLMELELIEPVLYLARHQDAPARLARAVLAPEDGGDQAGADGNAAR